MASTVPGRLWLPTMAAMVVAVLAAGSPHAAAAAACPNFGPACTASQTDDVTVATGSLSLSFASPTDSFGTLNVGQNASVGAGAITETNTLADGLGWSTTVVASILTSGGNTINQSNLSLNSTSVFACGASGCAGAGAGATAPNATAAFSGATPQTVMNGTVAAQGEIVQTGVQYTLAVPFSAIASATPYTGTLTYTITG